MNKLIIMTALLVGILFVMDIAADEKEGGGSLMEAGIGSKFSINPRLRFGNRSNGNKDNGGGEESEGGNSQRQRIPRLRFGNRNNGDKNNGGEESEGGNGQRQGNRRQGGGQKPQN